MSTKRSAKKLRASLIAGTLAAAIALTGTFAWQSISQLALNEAASFNPGGRLHDDFSGYNAAGVTDKTKDIYVENFADLPIYARVRLDEYMEIGAGAGLKPTDADYADKAATSLVDGAEIDKPETWTTHVPAAADPAAADNAADDPFHTYWTWALGGKTVYMPTFNKNKDSRAADINGTMAGLDPDDDLHYDDYVKYEVGNEKTADAYYDIDDNTTDEDPTKPGHGGTVNVNYRVSNEKHTAAETLEAQVITMAEYEALGDDAKQNLKAWVWDTDGWAYWSQAIKPGTATGLLLDGITLTTAPTDQWYYAINAVGQFITADDLGRNNKTGFYAIDTEAPSPKALDLLKSIGVKIDAALAVRNADNIDLNGMTIELKKGGEITLNAATRVKANDWNWTVDDESIVTLDNKTNAMVKATVQNTEGIEGKTATITVTKGDDASQIATVKITVVAADKAVTYKAGVKETAGDTVTDKTVELTQGTEANYAGFVLGSDGSTLSGGSWAWTVAPDDGKITVNNGKVTVTESAAAGDKATVTATYTAADAKTYAATFTVKAAAKAADAPTPVDPAYALTLAADGGATTVKPNSTLHFTPTLTKDGEVFTTGVTYVWSTTTDGCSVEDGTLTVGALSADDSVNVTATAKVDGAAVATATASVTVTGYEVVWGDISGAAEVTLDTAAAYTLGTTTVDGNQVQNTVKWSVKKADGSAVDAAKDAFADNSLTVKSQDLVGANTLKVVATCTYNGSTFTKEKLIGVKDHALTWNLTCGGSVGAGETLALTAEVSVDGGTATSSGITWTGTGVSGGALTGGTAGTTMTVTASYTYKEKTYTHDFNISVEEASTVTVTVNTDGNATAVEAGGTLGFRVTVLDKDNNDQTDLATVAWSVDKTSKTNGITIPDGTLTVPDDGRVHPNDNITVTVTVIFDGEMYPVTKNITVQGPDEIVVNKPSEKVIRDGTTTYTFTANVKRDNKDYASGAVTWAVSGNTDENTTINENTGVLTVGADETRKGTLTITAASKVDTGVKGTATVFVVSDGVDLKGVAAGSSNAVTIDDVEWYVLATSTIGSDDEKALILSKNMLEKMSFNMESSNYKWAESKIRTYLNGDWLNKYSTLKKYVQDTTINVRSNPTSWTDSVSMTDKVFLLSEADVFGTENYGQIVKPESKFYTTGSQLSIPNNNATTFDDGTEGNWWLRSNSNTRNGTTGLSIVHSSGILSWYSANQEYYGVRPALWVKIQ